MIKIFKNLSGKEWIVLLFSAVLIYCQVWFDLRIPEYMTNLTMLISQNITSTSEVLLIGAKMLGCAFASLGLAFVVGFGVARIAARMSLTLRSKLFSAVESFSMEEINGFSTSSLITRSTNDINQIQMIIAMGVQVILKAPLTAVLAIIKMQVNGLPEWTTLTVATVAFLILVISLIMSYALPKFKRVQGLTDNLNRVARENLTGLKVVRAYNAESYQEELFKKANTEFTDNNLKAQRVMAFLNPIMIAIMNIITLGIYWIGAFAIDKLVVAERVPMYANMMVFSQYAMQVIMAFTMLTMIFIMLPRATVSAKRINEVLETKPSVVQGEIENSKVEDIGKIEFKNVFFKYPGAEDYALEDISFQAERGETLAIIGATGSGKSTILHLLTRFYDATSGEVLVDGENVKNYKFETLYKKLGIVPQKSNLFSGTIKENIAFGAKEDEEISKEQMEKSAEIAQALNFIKSKQDGFESSVAQGGKNFSGGQQQRLSIARAIAKSPEILVFDDSFSALDYKTDRILRGELKKQIAGTTSVIVGQRIGTIMDADQILVVDEGKIVGKGTHQDLLQTCEVYSEIALSQLSKEEL